MSGREGSTCLELTIVDGVASGAALLIYLNPHAEGGAIAENARLDELLASYMPSGPLSGGPWVDVDLQIHYPRPHGSVDSREVDADSVRRWFEKATQERAFAPSRRHGPMSGPDLMSPARVRPEDDGSEPRRTCGECGGTGSRVGSTCDFCYGDGSYPFYLDRSPDDTDTMSAPVVRPGRPGPLTNLATLEEVDRELRGIANLIEPLLEQERALQETRHRLVSLAWIEANDVRREDVTLYSEGMTLGQFIAFLDQQPSPRKPFVECDGEVYRRAEFLRAPLSDLESCRLEDLPS